MVYIEVLGWCGFRKKTVLKNFNWIPIFDPPKVHDVGDSGKKGFTKIKDAPNLHEGMKLGQNKLNVN